MVITPYGDFDGLIMNICNVGSLPKKALPSGADQDKVQQGPGDTRVLGIVSTVCSVKC